MPVLSLSFGGGIYCYLVVYFLALYAISFLDDDGESSKLRSVSGILALILSVIFCFVCISNSKLFHSAEYRKMIGQVKEEKFTANIAPVSPDQMITVDDSIAARIGGKVLGEDPGLGSRCELGDFTMQVVKGHLYWIAPLLHSGFWKWSSNGDTPGYVVVSATDERDYRLVKEVNGKPLSIRYQPSAYWGDDLSRHVYTSGYASEGFNDFSFEVDDEWQPYWTLTTYDSTIGFSGDDATGVLVIDPKSGDITKYKVDKAPTWCDRIHPKDFVATQVTDWGELIHGYWNWSGNDKLHSADESSIVLGSDNKMYYYFGLESKGNEQGTVGFMMVNCRTKEATWIKQAGATENAAKKSAEGSVQEKGYHGSDGITYNIAGHPTYEFLLKDKSGLMKNIALVSVHDHSVVGIGVDRQTAISSYTMKMNSRGNASIGEQNDVEIISVTGIITRINGEVNSTSTTYYFMISGYKNQFVGNSSISTEFCLTNPGDKVAIKFVSESGTIAVMTFDNKAIDPDVSALQQKSFEAVDSVSDEHLVKKQEEVSDQKWEDLTPAEKQKLLKKNK